MQSNDIFDNILLIPGSSSLLKKGILPVSKSGSIPTLSDRWTIDDFVKSGVDRDEAELFLSKFGTAQVKKGGGR